MWWSCCGTSLTGGRGGGRASGLNPSMSCPSLRATPLRLLTGARTRIVRVRACACARVEGWGGGGQVLIRVVALPHCSRPPRRRARVGRAGPAPSAAREPPPPLLRCGLGSREAAGRRRGWLLRADPGRAGRAAKTATCRQSIENGQARGDRCFVRLGTHRGCPEVGDAFVQTAQTREADGERSRLLAIRFTRVGTGNSRCKRI